MCITVNHANLSSTKILSIPLPNGNHYIAYSNKVKNESGKPNAMILPIPGETNPGLFHNTESYKDFLEEITEKCDLEEDYFGIRSRGMKGGDFLSFEQFELGMYTVGLAKEFTGIREFLDQLPESKRPEIFEELKAFFEEKYTGWSFAVCVFSSDKAIDAQPIAFEYKPFGPNLLFFPTMDGHDGKAPRVGAMVKTDHTLIYEHTGKMTDKYYEQQHVTLEAKVPEMLQNRRYRAVFSRGFELNGDTFVNIDMMNESEFKNDPEFKRIGPVPYVAAKKEEVKAPNQKIFYGIAREIRKFKWGGFIVLETFNGQYQCVLKNLDVASIKSESHIKIVGEEVPATIKKELVVSDKEINVSSFEILSEPHAVPGINIYEKDINADTHLIFDQRALTLRNEKNKCIFKVQSYIHNAFRNYLTQNGFYSISTPKLVANGAEGGTNVFELDYFGKKAYLAQSPQLYKQMACGALGKVFETAPVFRAEKHNSSRHLNEYLSLDLETIIEKDFYELIELEKDLLYSIFYDIQRKMSKEFEYLGIEQFPKSSNPRNALILKVSEIKTILGTEGYDLSADDEKAIAKYALEQHGTEFVFATHFHKSVRPFYTKLSPDGITTESFDLIYKGVEITSGGQRKEKYQEYIDALAEAGMNQEPFEGYLEAFKYGMPLHGGFALGLERLTAKICGIESVKAATLFPRDVDRLTP